MLRSHAARNITTSLLITAAGVAAGLIWASRRQPASPVAARRLEPAPTRILPSPQPSQARSLPRQAQLGFDGNEPELTAAPRATAQRLMGADDYEALGPDELSEAFLTRATESWASVDDGSDVDLQGFQLATIEDLTTPKLRDDPADFEIPEKRG